MTRDNIKYIKYTDPQTLNLYEYCGDNPVSNTDPNGNLTGQQWATIGVVGTAVGLGVLTLVAPEIGVPLDLAAAEAADSPDGQELLEESEEEASATNSAVNANDLNHYFGKPYHNLSDFLSLFNGDQVAAFNAIQETLQQYVDANNITDYTKGIAINVNGIDITVKGMAVNGVARIGTFYIPNQ